MMGEDDPLAIGHEVLEAALLRGGRVDASARILNGVDEVVLSDRIWGAHLATPTIPSGKLDPLELFGPGSAPPPKAQRMSARRFEMLSLAARVRAARDAKLAWRIKDAKTEAEKEQQRLRNLELWKESRLAKAAEALGLNLNGFAEVSAEHVQGLLAWACDELGPDQGRRGTARTHEQLAMRAGLQLIGCRITAAGADGLRLVNARLPLSLRLIGCVVDCPILLAHTQLVSLDLSGSSMTGLDAGGLRAGGNIHLRRAVVTSQVTLAGARVEGNLNAAQMVVAPFRRTMAHAPVETEHGIVNLSKIDVGGEVSLGDARIWGGLSLRGAKLGRSLTLTGAVVVSPLGLFEKRVSELLDRTGLRKADRAGDPAMVDHVVAATLHPEPAWAEGGSTEGLNETDLGPVEVEEARLFGWAAADPAPGAEARNAVKAHVEAKRDLERLDYEDRVWGRLAKVTLRHLDARSLMAAVRADGMQVAGTVFARRAFFGGKVRLRYARIDGTMRLEGTLLRSAEAIGRSCVGMIAGTDGRPVQEEGQAPADLDTELDWILTRQDGFREEHTAVALDMRDTRVAGGVMMGRELTGDFVGRIERRASRAKASLGRERQDPTEVEGNLLMKGFVTHGDLILAGAHFTPLADSADFGRKQPLSETPASLRAENAEIAGDVDLRRSCGLWGLDLQNAAVGGDVRLSDKVRLEPYPSEGRDVACDPDGQGFRKVGCKHRATAVRGEVDLRGATVGGDALLVFDPAAGPVIKASLLSVKGRLGLHPQTNPGDQDQESFVLRPPDASRKADAADEKKASGSSRKPYVDLRHARCSVFIHPPQAWPSAEALSLDGFRYEQAHEVGPLAPHPHPAGNAKSWVLKGLVFGGLASMVLGLLLWWAADAAVTHFGRKLILHPNTGIALFLGVGMIAIYACARVLLPRVAGTGSGPRRPKSKDLDPRAIAYLARQRRLPNRFRLFRHHHPVMDTYLQAAQALRSAGRFHAANAIERARLRIRSKNLSWRHHGFAKGVLKVVDWVSGFGFELSRTAIMFGVLVVGASMLADYEASAGRLAHKHDAVVTLTEDAGLTLAEQEHPDPDLRPGLIYGLDLVLPLDLGAVGAWEAPEQGSPANLAWQAARTVGMSDWRSIFAMLGLVLSTIFGLALASRAESALANVKE